MRRRFSITMSHAVLTRLDANAAKVGAARSLLIESAVVSYLDADEPGAVGTRAREATIAVGSGRPLPMRTRPVNGRRKEPRMLTNEIVAEGERIVAELDRLRAQYQSAIEADYRDFGLTVEQMSTNARRYADRVRERAAEVREGWLNDAYLRLGELNANPPPPPVKDPRARFYVLHRLVGLPASERLEAVSNAVSVSDRLTFDVVCEAPSYVDLLKPADLERVKAKWHAKHGIHPKSGYHNLAAVIETVLRLLTEVEACARQPVTLT